MFAKIKNYLGFRKEKRRIIFLLGKMRLGERLNSDQIEELINLIYPNEKPKENYLNRLRYKLKFGEIYLRSDGKWACIVCGGNCGQCGDTEFYGNIGFSMDHLARNLHV